tara:strand:+ start:383 stop:814 length:432 start_codon:yes stop_codon:yes gene_type:complete
MENTILKLGLFIATLFTIDYLMTNNQKTYISHSKINGNGLFASKDFKKGDILIDDLFKNKPKNEKLYDPISYDKFQKYINVEGRYINHCNKQINSKVVSKDNKLYKLIATKNIQKDDEITANYNKINKNFPFIAKAEKDYLKC